MAANNNINVITAIIIVANAINAQNKMQINLAA